MDGGELYGTGEMDVTSFISSGLKEGLSGNAILSDLQDSGMGFRRANFFGILGEVRASLGKAGALADLNPESTLSDEHYSTWRQAPEGVNIYQVEIHLSDPNYGNVSAPYSVMTNENLTVDQAVSKALDAYTSNNQKYAQRIFGGMLVGAYRAPQ